MKKRNPMFFPSLWNIIAVVNRPFPKRTHMLQMGGDYLLHHFSMLDFSVINGKMTGILSKIIQCFINPRFGIKNVLLMIHSYGGNIAKLLA